MVDLGSNFGFYCFLARQKGADRVVGIDLDDLVIQGSELLRDMNHIQNVLDVMVLG